jgi:hypothetical protein
MEAVGPIYDARRAFQTWVATKFTFRREGEEYLQEYLLAWLEEGDGLEWTGRSYENYLRVALDIADATMRGQIKFDYVGTEENNYEDGFKREVVAIHEDDMPASHYAERMTYDVTVYRREYEGTGRLTLDIADEIRRVNEE